MAGKDAHTGERILAGTIVDDIFVTGPVAMLKAVLSAVSDAFGGAVTHEWDPTGFGGFQLRRNFDTRAITIALPEKIFQLATLLNVMHKPAEDDKFGPPAITKEDLDEIDFDRTNDKLTADQKLCQKATRLLTWIAQVRLDISFYARKCSRVMSAPKSEPVLKVLRAITLALLKKPHMGKTFSQSPGVTDLEIIKSSMVTFDADKVAPAAFEIV